MISPGHNSVVKSPDGKEDWIVYHAAKYSGAGWDRTLRLQKLEWDGNVPKVELSAWTEEVNLPSGDVSEKVKYEAEDAVKASSCFVETFEKGRDFSYASSEKAVGFQTDGTEVRFEFKAKREGRGVIAFRYSNAQDAKGKVKTQAIVNGEEISLSVPYTHYEELFTLTQINVKFQKGKNVVTFRGLESLYLDCIVATYL